MDSIDWLGDIMTLVKLNRKIKKVVELQEYYFKRRNHDKCSELGEAITALMEQREEVLTEQYANEITNTGWYWKDLEVKAEEAVLA